MPKKSRPPSRFSRKNRYLSRRAAQAQVFPAARFRCQARSSSNLRGSIAFSKIDYENRLAVVETGVINVHLSQATSPHGFHYAPDPSSQMACTIGGNVAENSGGPHCLKYGMTTNHVLALEVVLPTGEIVTLGGGGVDRPGYDLLGVFVGSEGTFGIATQATLKLTRLPQSVKTLLAEFMTVTDASRSVQEIIAGGILPAALEMIDRATIRAIENSIFAGGFPTDVAALLIIEIDGLTAGLEETARALLKSAFATTRGPCGWPKTMPNARALGRSQTRLRSDGANQSGFDGAGRRNPALAFARSARRNLSNRRAS